MIRSEKVDAVASEFDHIHNVQRVGSTDHVILPFAPTSLKHWIVESSGNWQRTAG